MKIISLSIAALITPCAVASSFDFHFLPASTAHQTLSILYPLAGTFIGDYDATTNPTGTRTIPGYFGGSGNQAIPYTSKLRLGDALDSNPLGSFKLDIGANGMCTITNFTTDLVNETPGAVTIDMLFTYSSFHTVAPNAIFPSVGEITIPIATGSLKVATAVQSGPAVGALVETAPNTYTISIPIPVNVLVSGSAAGQPFGGDPVPAILAFAGTLTINGATATFISSAASTDPVGPLPALPALVNQPLPVPTVLPAGSTANLLLSGTFSEGTGTSVLNISVNATGIPSYVLGDMNADGHVTGLDLAYLLSAWGTANPTADINHDGIVAGWDLTALLSNWGA